MIGRDTIHVLGLLCHAAKEVSSAHHNRNTDAESMHVSQFSGNLVDARRLDTKALICRQSLTGKFQQDSFEDRGRHFSSDSTGLSDGDWIIPPWFVFPSEARNLGFRVANKKGRRRCPCLLSFLFC